MGRPARASYLPPRAIPWCHSHCWGPVPAMRMVFSKCNGTQSFDGTVVPAVDEGKSIVNSDCTGQITYNKGPPQELDINFLILHDGRELRGMLQNAGTAVQCDRSRMGTPDDHDHE